MAYQTLTFSETSKGWPSFYTYEAENLRGMNNYFYSFDKGNIYRHNSNTANRNEFYGITYASSIKTVINKQPLEAKLFKTIELEASPSAWGVFATSESPIANFPDPDPQQQNPGNTISANQSSAQIQATEFELKEGSWYSYLRNSNTTAGATIPVDQYGLRSIKGVGTPVNPSGLGPPPFGVNGIGTATCTIQFPVSLSSTLSVGDYFYQVSTALSANVNIGPVVAINGNVVTVDNTPPATPAVDTDFIYYVQNSTAESHGLVGHYLELTLTGSGGGALELFAVKTDYMKSYP